MKLICFLLAILMIFNMSVPLFAQTQIREQFQARQDANRDATADHKSGMWFVVGCLFPGIGLLTSQFVPRNAPASALIGKTPQYVATYTETYKRKKKRLQARSAVGGCLTGTLITGGIGFALAIVPSEN